MTAPVTLLEEVAMLLAELGVGTYRPAEVDGTIYLLRLPQSPDVCMSVTPYSGEKGDAGLPWDKPRFQIRCRGTKANATLGYALAHSVWSELQGLGSQRLPGGTWMVQCLGVNDGPGYMGVDENGRDEYVVNVEIEVSTGARRARAV